MAKITIDQLPDATVPLSGTERIAVVQGGMTKDVAASDLPVSTATTTAIATAIDPLNDFRVWDSGRTYSINDPVFHLGIPYRAITANTNQAPATNPDDWEVVGGSGGGSKNFLKNPLTKNNVINVTTTGATGSWGASPAIVVDGSYSVPSFATGDTIDIDLDTVNASDGGQSWEMSLGYFIATGATYVDGNLVAYLLDGASEIAGGNIPIVLNQVNKTAVWVYPSTTLTGLKLRIKCFGGTGTFSIADLSVAPQEKVVVPAVGPWQSYVPPGVITNAPGSWTKAQNRRNGDQMDFDLEYTLSGAVTGAMGCSQTTILPAGLTTSDAGKSVPITILDSGVTYWSGVWDLGGLFYGPNGQTAWYNINPITWASGDRIYIRISLKINQYSNTIQVSGEGVEYASNSDVTATASVTASGFINGFGNFGTFGSGWVAGSTFTRRIKFTSPINWGRDELILGLRDNISPRWYDDAEQSGQIVNGRQGTSVYGYTIIPVIGDNYSADVTFAAGGRISTNATYGGVGAAFSDFGLNWNWWIKKTSGGNLAQVPPVVFAEATGCSSTASGAVLNLTTKTEDTNNILTVGASAKMVANIAGKWRLSGLDVVVHSATIYSALGYRVNGGTIKVLTDPSTTYTGSVLTNYGKTVKLNQGDIVELIATGGGTHNAIASSYYQFEYLGK